MGVQLPERCVECQEPTPAYTSLISRTKCSKHGEQMTARELELLNHAKQAAHTAYLAAAAVLTWLDETAPDHIVKAAETAKKRAWETYNELVLETEW